MLNKEDFKLLESTDIFKGSIMHIKKDTISLPNGKSAIRETLKHIGATASVVLTNENKLILVKQYRHAYGDLSWELPAGLLDPNEIPVDCAKREVEEETGYKCNSIEFMFKIYPTMGYSTEVIHVYLAKDLVKTSQNLDPDEFVETAEFTLEETEEMIKKGDIVDGKTIAGILFYKSYCK
ncbi:MAG: NUDIX hydrolase [Lachnospirales bacterium]